MPSAPESAAQPTPPDTALFPSAAKEKDQTIETLRGLAIVCVVIGHVIGDTASVGLAVEPRSLYRYWYDVTRYLRMPMFLAISGFLYAHRPVTPGKYAEFLRGKARLLLLPFLSVATLQYLMKGIVPGVNAATHLSDIWRIYVYEFDQFWFSQAMILTFTTVLALEKLLPMAPPRKWLSYLFLAILLNLFGPRIALFSLRNYESLLPLFFLGCLLYRPPAWLRGWIALKTVLVVFLVTLTMQQLRWFGLMSFHGHQLEWLRLSLGSSFLCLIFRFRWSSPTLAFIGGSAYPIYLFHVFGTAGSRILMLRLGIHERLILFVVGVVCGVALPIVLERVLERNAIFRRVFLGRR